jgi:hypothetical protein
VAARLRAGARDLLDTMPPAEAMRRWMDLFGEWIATKNGMPDTLLAMVEAGDIAHDHPRRRRRRRPTAPRRQR